MIATIEDLRSRLAASHVAIEHAEVRLTDAKQAAIAASANRLAVEALVAAKVLFVNEAEVVAARAADVAAGEQVAAARQGVRRAQDASLFIKQDLLDAEGPARRAAEVAENERRMAWVERTHPNLLADLEEARERLTKVSRFDAVDGATPSIGGLADQARQRVDKLERELNQRLAKVPDDVVAPALSARGKR